MHKDIHRRKSETDRGAGVMRYTLTAILTTLIALPLMLVLIILLVLIHADARIVKKRMMTYSKELLEEMR
jgi:hypothetical protein